VSFEAGSGVAPRVPVAASMLPALSRPALVGLGTGVAAVALATSSDWAIDTRS